MAKISAQETAFYNPELCVQNTISFIYPELTMFCNQFVYS